MKIDRYGQDGYYLTDGWATFSFSHVDSSDTKKRVQLYELLLRKGVKFRALKQGDDPKQMVKDERTIGWIMNRMGT